MEDRKKGPSSGAVPATLRLADGASFRNQVAKAVRAPLLPSVVVIAGPDLGRRQKVEGSFVIGRDPQAAFALTDPAVSWQHARIEDRGDGWALVDDRSTNGTRVNGELRTDHVLSTNDKIQLGDTVLRFEVQDATDQAYEEMLQRLLTIDDLSGLYQRRRFDQELAQLLAAAETAGTPVGMLVMDLDGVKAINDAHGHLFGAYVIGESGHVIGRVIANKGIAARFGGDEYVVAVPGHDIEAARALGESILAAIRDHHFEREDIVLRPGISIGVAAYPLSASDAENLFNAADRALYKAKHAGKNCVRLAD